MSSGVYKLTHVPSGEFYIGSSADIDTRKQSHLGKIRAGSHLQARIAAQFADCTDGDVAFEVLEECDPEDLLDREVHWFDTLSPTLNAGRPCNTGRPTAPKPKGYVYGIRLDLDTKAKVKKYTAKGNDLQSEAREFIVKQVDQPIDPTKPAPKGKRGEK